MLCYENVSLINKVTKYKFTFSDRKSRLISLLVGVAIVTNKDLIGVQQNIKFQ